MRVGFLSLLTICFITLKLMGYISWSWWWVLAPSWIPIAFIILFIILSSILSNKYRI